MIRLALEVPVGIPELLQITDFDFVLAQDVVENRLYREMYETHRVKGRTMMLDNGFHELGKPMTVPELVYAVELMNPDVVVSPDNFKDAKFTLDQYFLLKAEFEARQRTTKIAVVISGETEMERAHFFEKLRGEDVVWCFPYRVPRLEWFVQLTDRFPKAFLGKYVHLLGWRDKAELKNWLVLSHSTPVSLDTSKPVKWGMLNHKLDAVGEIRHAPVVSATLTAEKDFTDLQRSCIYYNVAWLKARMT